MLSSSVQSDVAALLAWYRDMGVDAALTEQPIDWLARGNQAPGAGFELQTVTAQTALPEVARQALPSPPSPAHNLDSGPPWAIDEAAARSSARPAASHKAGIPYSAPQQSRPPAPSSPQMRPPSAPSRPQPGLAAGPPDAAVMAARELAKSANSLEELQALLQGFDGCGLKATAKSMCFYRGAAKARLMIIGEAPGRDEDLAGKPFVGRAGQLLDKMLASIGLTDADAHITNIVYWRPPGNRTPTPQEAQVCRPFLERQIELVEPKFILSVGGPATQNLMNVTDGIMKVRGKWREIQIGGASVRVLPTLHPAYLLRTPAAKRQAWRDLRLLRSAMGDVSD